MKRPYLVIKNNPDEELEVLKHKAEANDPLEFLSHFKINGEWANDITFVDINNRLEFAIIDDSLIGKIQTALTDFGFDVTIEDVTKDFLFDRIDLSNASKKIRRKIDKFYYSNFDCNDILDKISVLLKETKKETIELSEVDKAILKLV